VIVVLVVVLVSVYCYGCGVTQFVAQSEKVSGSQSSSGSESTPEPESTPGSPNTVQPRNDKLASSSSITVNTKTQASSSQPGSSVKLGVYGNDPSRSQPQALQAIDWSAYGSLVPGQSVNSSKVYLRNEGNVPVTLALSAADWAFQNSSGSSLSQSYQQYFALTWNYDNARIGVNETRAVTFSLTLSPSIVDVATFSFRLVVTATY
jgi:hypothetical protein